MSANWAFRLARVAALLVASGLAALAAPAALTPAQEARAQALGGNLRCPICTGVPITESTNDLSHEMLQEVREQVAAGRSTREVYQFFAARYGNFVLLDPPKEGSGALLWGAPLLALGAGGAVLWRVLRRRDSALRAAPAQPAAEPDPFDSFLAQVQRETTRHAAPAASPEGPGPHGTRTEPLTPAPERP